MPKIQPSPARQGSSKRLRLPREINNNHFQSWDPTRSTQNGLRLSSSGYLENHRNKKPGAQFGHTQEKPWPHKRPENQGSSCAFSPCLPFLPASSLNKLCTFMIPKEVMLSSAHLVPYSIVHICMKLECIIIAVILNEGT